MYQVLARKYRPQTFAELVGQEHVRTTLENAIARERIAHGYIFSGQRGTGKTTVARILARCLNCVAGPTASPCGTCSSCREVAAGNSVDVIEIDAASNRGINEMRELRESIKYRPARDRYKVFIIDEAHQITSEAFNALLKTLEEPPEWVVFILCTTEAHKIPTTIASRCQQFAFRSLDFEEVVELMRRICEQESIETDPEVLGVLALAGEGSVRDSLSALDQAIACCGTRLDAAEVRPLLGMFSLASLHRVTEALVAGDSRRMLEIVQDLERDGRNLQHFCRELARYFRNLLVVKVAGSGSRLVAATPEEERNLAGIAASFSEEDLARYLQLTLDLFRELQFSLQPRLHLEIGLLKLVHAGRLVSIEEALAQGGAPSAPAVGGGNPPRRPLQAKQTTPATEPLRNVYPPARPPIASAAGGAVTPERSGPPAADLTEWKSRLLEAARERGLTFVADAIEHAALTEHGGELQLAAPRDFTLALRSGDFKTLLAQVAGKPVKVSVTVAETSAAESGENPRPEDEASERALGHPEVRRFQELFPGSQVRTIRNLKQ